MTRCAKFHHLFDEVGDFCGMSPSAISQYKAYREQVKKLVALGIDEDFVFENFPEGPGRVLSKIHDDETRVKALNYVAACLKRKEKVTEGDLKAHIKNLLGSSGNSCSTNARRKNFTNVKSATPDSDVKPPAPSVEPVRGSSLFKTAAEVKAGIAGEMFPDNKPAEPAATEAPPAWSTAVCTSGKCPDGNTHVVSWQLGKKCDLSGMFLKDQTFCPILERQKRAAEQGFVPAGTAAPQVCSATGGTIRRELPPLVAKKGQPEIVYHPTPKQYEFIERVMRLEDLKTPEDAINLLVEQAMEAQV